MIQMKHFATIPEKPAKHEWLTSDIAADECGSNWSDKMSVLTLTLPGTDKTFFTRLKVAYKAYRDSRARRVATHTLAELDDHFLKDIGITRSEILSVVYGSRDERRRGYEDTAG
jgi:uncharacterized protein YjiS (DUF1127 family)